MREFLNTSEKVGAAWDYAKDAHSGQTRKVGGYDYFDAHVDPVAALVAAHGGSEDEVAAALLHDTVEDCERTLTEIAETFGVTVATYVDYVTERLKREDGFTYKVRKSDYIERLSDAPLGALRVCAADKLRNSLDVLRNARDGVDVIALFPSFFWYHDGVLAALAARSSEFDPGLTELYDALAETVDAVRRLTSAEAA
jgi:(p)ppGpp synthase/HD superfamily hydrolase